MPKSNKPLAVIISPTYNERPNIKKLIPILDAVFKGVKNWRLKLLVVDDSSPDGTADEVKKLQKQYRFVELLLNKEKAGLGGAYLRGMEYAFGEMKADVVFEIDADLSHDPKKIPEFLEHLDSGSDMVLGSRYIPGGSIPSNWGLHRKFLSVFGNFVIQMVFMTNKIKDWTGGFRAIRREVYEAVVPELQTEQFSGYTFQIGFLHKAYRRGYKISEVPFHFVDRTEGVSKLGPEYLINILRYIFWVRLLELLNNRLVKFVMVGGFGFLVNLVAYHLYKYLQLWTGVSSLIGWSSESGWASTVFSNEGFAVALGAETAIVSNYIWSNMWTFADRKIKGISKHLNKFLQFNLGSVGSVVIQYIVMQLAVRMIGVFTMFTLLGIAVTSDNLYLVIGVLIGMIWNFSIYSLVIWRK